MLRTGMFLAVILACMVCIFSASQEPFQEISRPKVCVYMFSTPNIVPEYAGLAAKINEAYARKWGYEFVHEISDVPDVKLVAWERVRMLRQLISSHSAVFYIDGDACFQDHTESLESLINEPGDIVASSDHPNGVCAINAGTFLAKNTPWTRDFAAKWMSMKTDPRCATFPLEQKAFNILYKENWNSMKDHVTILPASAMNSVYTDVISGKGYDTFVLHLMSLKSDYRRNELKKVAERLAI